MKLPIHSQDVYSSSTMITSMGLVRIARHSKKSFCVLDIEACPLVHTRISHKVFVLDPVLISRISAVSPAHKSFPCFLLTTTCYALQLTLRTAVSIDIPSLTCGQEMPFHRLGTGMAPSTLTRVKNLRWRTDKNPGKVHRNRMNDIGTLLRVLSFSSIHLPFISWRLF